MAFGRSNSLSLNTGATNSLFSQQNPTQNATSQPSQAGGLFGASTQPQQSGGLFGSTATSQPQQTSSLFGNTSAQQPQQTSSLFGNTTTQQPQQSSLFGNTTTAQPQQQSGGLFGNTNTQQPQQQQQTGGGLFGSSTMPASQPAAGSSLFGNNAGTSLFNTQPDNQRMTGNSFYHAQNNPQQNSAPTTSIFGLSAVSADQLPSLLHASQYNMSTSTNQRRGAFPGALTMGQGGTQQGQQTATVGAVKVNVSELRGTTRFADCVPEIQSEFEKADAMIQAQEKFCREIQAVLAQHSLDIDSLDPDVKLIAEQTEGVEAALAADAQAVERSKKVVDADRRDLGRVVRVVENQKLPVGYQVANSVWHDRGGHLSAFGAAEGDGYDTDLIGNYFLPLASSLQQTFDMYTSNLAEIEGHLRVVEASTVAQAQSLAGRRQGGGINSGGGGGEDTVRELADTLRGFEQSILGVAGAVGECREGVNGLVLGRLGETVGGRRGW